jgi:predicted nucleic acid-binding Zn ribbon protein
MKCEKCGKEHDGSYGSGRFCSSYCARSYSTANETKGTKIVQCIKCGKDIEVDKRASAKLCKCDDCVKNPRYDNKHCLNCGKQLLRNHKYCSFKCQNDYQYKEYIKKWKNGEIDSEHKNGLWLSSYIKRYIKEKQGHICSICRNTEWNGKPIPLVLDHINGNPYDDSENNLRFVCGNCDMQLPTYKSKNKGNGRHERRKRYRDNKSF